MISNLWLHFTNPPIYMHTDGPINVSGVANTQLDTVGGIR